MQYTSWGWLPPVAYGHVGVRVFFVLSGFLVGGILLDLRPAARAAGLGATFKAFYIRRSLRIFPVFYAFLAALAVFETMRWGDRFVSRELPWHLSYLTNFRLATGTDEIANIPIWSLCVEEHFYLLAPCALLLLSWRAIERGCLAMIALGLLGRILKTAGVIPIPWMFASPFQFDALAAGVLVAMLARRGTALGIDRRRLAAIGVGAALIYALAIADYYHPLGTLHQTLQTLDDSSAALWSAALVLALWERRLPVAGRVLSFRPFTYLGTISYALYLFHSILLRLVGGSLGRDTLRHAAVAFVMTVIAASISWRFFEGPINSLKRFFPYPRSEAAAPARLELAE